MFSQLIYTRCTLGRDLTKNGQLKTGSGFKIFSFSSELLSEQNGLLDLPFIEDNLRKELPYEKRDAVCVEAPDPTDKRRFTDDAFMYIVPNVGLPMIMDFNVRIYIRGISDRPGNFINHAFVGKPDTYPACYINSPSFTAKNNDEQFYYTKGSTPPDYLPQVKALIPNPDFSFERAGEFIRHGKYENLLKNAVWFILRQYDLKPEERKFIVIRAVEEDIENWICAIGYAFSPDIAQLIPFATRLSHPVTENRYRVNPDGMLSTNPGAPFCLRAMIVGSDTRDVTNTLKPHAMPTDPYVLLEDIVPDSTEIKSPYFSLITGFDEEHKRFITDFLSCDDGKISRKSILDCSKLYKDLNSDSFALSAEKLQSILTVIESGKIKNIPNWDKLQHAVLDGLNKHGYPYSLAVSVIAINKKRGTDNNSFTSKLVDNMAVSYYNSIKNLEISVNKGITPDAALIQKAVANMNYARTMFNASPYYGVYGKSVLKQCIGNIRFEITPLNKADLNQTVNVFFDNFIECMDASGENLKNGSILTYICSVFRNLLAVNSGYNRLVVDKLGKIYRQNSENITLLRRNEASCGEALTRLIRMEFTGSTPSVNNYAELVKLCAGKVSSGAREDELEYFLAEYSEPALFSSDMLLGKVLFAVSPLKNQFSMGKPMPEPVGRYFFEKKIERCGKKGYINLIAEIMSCAKMLSKKVIRELLSLLDSKLALNITFDRFIPTEYIPKGDNAALAEKITEADPDKFYSNAFLVNTVTMLINGQMDLNYCRFYIRCPLKLPCTEYARGLIAALTKRDTGNTDAHFSYLCLFGDNTDIYKTYVSEYIERIIDVKTIKAFTDFVTICYNNRYKDTSQGYKLCCDLFGDDYNTQESFTRLCKIMLPALKSVYENKFSSDQRAKSGIVKLLGNKDKRLLQFYAENIGLPTGTEANSKDNVKAPKGDKNEALPKSKESTKPKNSDVDSVNRVKPNNSDIDSVYRKHSDKSDADSSLKKRLEKADKEENSDKTEQKKGFFSNLFGNKKNGKDST